MGGWTDLGLCSFWFGGCFLSCLFLLQPRLCSSLAPIFVYFFLTFIFVPPMLVNIPYLPSTFMRSTEILALRAYSLFLQEKCEGSTLQTQMCHQGRGQKGTLTLGGPLWELCGRVGLEEILALGSGLTRDAPHPTPRSRKTEKTHQNVAGIPAW